MRDELTSDVRNICSLVRQHRVQLDNPVLVPAQHTGRTSLATDTSSRIRIARLPSCCHSRGTAH
jgi:hypothetical protein